MNESAVGIDVSKLKLDVCVVDGVKLRYKVVKNTSGGHAELIAWLGRLLLQRSRPADVADVPVVLEATGPYSEAAATALAEAGWRVSVVNPARVKGFAQSQMSRNKTDKADARLLALFAQRAELEPWQPPSSAGRELHALVERLQALQDMRQQESNRLEALSQSISLGRSSRVITMVKAHVEWLITQIAEIESEIGDHIDSNPALKRDAELMRSIPGCGPKLAAQFLAYVGDVRRFKNAKAPAAFIGVTPRQKQSGTSVNGRTTISRAGHTAARKALYMPGLVAKHHNPVIVAMAKRLASRGMAPKAIVGASMRKLVHMIYGVVNSGKSFDAMIPMRALAFQDGI